MRRGIGQANALVLGRDVAQIRGEVGELGRGAQPPVHEGPTPRLRFLIFPLPGLHHPADDELPLPPLEGAGHPRGLELRGDPGPRLDLEERLDLRLRLPRPHDVRTRPPPKDEGERVDDHRLAGPGFARQNVEAGLQFERHPLE